MIVAGSSARDNGAERWGARNEKAPGVTARGFDRQIEADLEGRSGDQKNPPLGL